ncbi:MAG TPA: DUF3604 domain-containing protein [Candidatus Binatia bacterium]|nr:DUF3604 domain-containing protein [Candidatus Binatia bacterium]
MRTLLRVVVAIVVLAVLVFGALLASLRGGKHEAPGEPAKTRVAADVVAARSQSERDASQKLAASHPVPAGGAAAPPDKQILFGDLHVHTTFSADAFQRSLPLLQGEGAHPPADACDYARFCSGLDFWSINDHAESVSPEHWRETKEAIRQCNAVAGDPKNPDVVAFLGFEWTQVGQTPETHYGHKNVIFRETAEDRVPKRPIGAAGRTLALLRQGQPLSQRLRLVFSDYPNRQRYLDFGEYQQELRKVLDCPAGVDTRQLPEDCNETAETPRELFEKLSQWGFDSIVIPHGTTWGLYTPPGVTFDKQLTKAQHDPDRQTLIEVFSGHGNSEEYRRWKEIDWDAKGNPVCPAPTKDYLPCCWQAGELIRARCANAPAEECERRVQAARLNYLAAGASGHRTVPGATPEDWLDCGQCRDCFMPAFSMRPGDSVQYTLAISNFDDPGAPRRFRFGFIASSDNHSARPGTGYKDYKRRMMTETTGARDATWYERLNGPPRDKSPESLAPADAIAGAQPFQVVDFERQGSFFFTGGLVAVHSAGRDRDAIWQAFQRREVYGTSGDRILLWFDLLNGPSGAAPMGSEVQLSAAPHFVVRAVGSFQQKPGCPDSSVKGLAPDRLELLCRGECYNPSDQRRKITRIEVVRIRPQTQKGEPVAPLIEDPWKKIDCPGDPAGCVVEFDDPEFASAGRDATYYVRAIQEPTPAINADGFRCTKDASGNCIQVKPCYGDYRTSFEDDCLAMNEERAWSSPIYVKRAGS